jgi:hypothetical protein
MYTCPQKLALAMHKLHGKEKAVEIASGYAKEMIGKDASTKNPFANFYKCFKQAKGALKMGYQDIKPGKYLAKAIQGQISKSKEKGTPGVAILFEFLVNEQPEKLWWTGWLTTTLGKDGKTPLERTMEVLAFAGYDESKGYLADGSIPSAHFLPGYEVEVTIEDEPYTNAQGETKSSMKIKWVNRPGGGQFAALQAGEVQNVLAGVDLRKEMMVARQKLGLKTTQQQAPKNYAPQTQAAAQQTPPPNFNEDNIPF